MSLTASRGTALLAPLPNGLAGRVATDTGPVALLAVARADTTVPASTSVPRATPHPVAQGPAQEGNATASVAAQAAPVATPATTDAAPGATGTAAPAPSSESAFAGRTATVAQIGKPTAMPPSPANAGSIGGAVLALAMVIGLILALGWLARRMPGFRGAAGSSALRVVGSLPLSPRERLVVVAVGETQLVLGVGAGGTRTLHTLSEPLPVPESGQTPAFAQLLSQHFGKKA